MMEALTKAIEELAHFLMVLLLGIIIGLSMAGAFYYKTAYKVETNGSIYLAHGVKVDKNNPFNSQVVDIRIPWLGKGK